MAGFWSIIIPEATTNLVTNPSIEDDTTGYTAVGGSIAKDTGDRRYGLSSLKITPTAGVNDGSYYGTVSLESGQSYTFSVDIKGAASEPYTIYFATTGGTEQGTSTDFTATGEWERQEVTWACDSTASYRLYITKNNDNNTSVFYIDGLQCENKAYSTTYSDGEQDGCEWSAAENASTSTRSAQSRAGGKVVNLDDYSFYVREMGGIGMPPLKHQTLDRPLLPGELFQGSKVQPRVFELEGTSIGTSHENLHSIRKDFLDAIKPDRVITDQHVILRYTGANSNKVAEIACVYDTGFQFRGQRGFAEDGVALRLIAYDSPFFRELGNDAVSLTTSQTITSVNYILSKVDGVWAKMGTGGDTGTVDAIVKAPDGTIYAAGSFAQMGGISNTAYIAKWDGSVWSALGTGANARVRALLLTPNGDLYAGGDFSAMGGVSDTDYIAKWNGSVWSALGTGMSTNVHALCLGLDGDIYAGGEFVTAGASSADYAARWDGSSWADLGNNLINNTVRCLATAPNGYIWMGGDMTDYGEPCERVLYYKPDDDAVTEPNDGVAANSVYALVVDDQGRVWIGGDFTSVGNLTCNRVALYDGQGWLQLGTGLGAACYSLDYEDGILYAGGAFTTAGNLTVADGIATWNGFAWTHFDGDLPGTATVDAVLVDGDDYYLGFNTSGSAIVSKDQTITNNGTRSSFPKIIVERSGGTTLGVKYVRNETTGAVLYLNYDLLDGEKLTIELAESKRFIMSSHFGTAWRALLRNSDVSRFFLLPGSNTISVYFSESGTPTITASFQWQNTHWSADGVAT